MHHDTNRRMGRGALLALAVGWLCVPVVSAQLFVEQSTTRFPQPDPNDFTNQITIGDINGDGHLDVIFANGGNFFTPGTPQLVRIYINDGTGVFTDESIARVGNGSGLAGLFRGVELGDVNGNGHLDMILAPDFFARPVLLINDGNGFFTNEAGRLPGTRVSSARAMFADIDNDGDLDLYITNGGSTNRFGCGQQYIYINDGNGFFTDETATRHPTGNWCEPMDIIFGDVNGNFDLDARFASTGSNWSRLLINDGSGVFTVKSTPPDQNCYSYDFGDINGNGHLDLFGANGAPSGNNSDILLVNDGRGNYTNESFRISPNPNVDDNDSKFFDYDNDGDLDLIVARLGGTSERIYNNDGSGNFTQVNGLITSIGDSTLDIMVADLNNDGVLDIVTGQGESGNYRNRLYIGTGPADTIPPTIRVEQVDAVEGSLDPLIVRASVSDGMTSDRGPFLSDVTLFYAYADAKGNPRTVPVAVPMRWSGHQIYRATMPTPPCDAAFAYWVAATDWAGNLGESAYSLVSGLGSTLLGDLDGSGSVDAADLGIMLNAFGATGDGDLNGDGITNAADLGILLAVFGSTCG